MFKLPTLASLSLIFAATTAVAEPIKTNLNANFHKLVHAVLYARAAGTEKPPAVILDKTLPRTQNNQGVMNEIEAMDVSPELLQSEGPIEILYHDFESRKLIPCQGSVSQQKGADKLMRINVDMKWSPDGISCVASGEYTPMSEAEKKDTQSHIAHMGKKKK